jgi:hypothetical protein
MSEKLSINNLKREKVQKLKKKEKKKQIVDCGLLTRHELNISVVFSFLISRFVFDS